MVKSNPCRTSGNQKCIGANPTFSPRAIIVIIIIVG